MLPKKFLRYDLSFHDKNLEEEYQKSRIKYNHLFLNIIILYGFLVCIISCSINPFHSPEQFNGGIIAYSSVLSSVSLVIFLIALKRPAYCKNLIIIQITLFFFSFMEIASANRPFWNDVTNFILGINIEFLALPLVLAKISWKKSSMLLLLINLFCVFRYTDFGINYQMNFFPLIQFLQNTCLISLSAYFVERFDREGFYKIITYENSLSHFKDLITTSFPSAVIILKDEKILFNNEKTLKILDCTEDFEVWSKLERLQMDCPNSAINEYSGKEYFITEDCKPIIQSDLSNEASIRLPQILNFNKNTQKYYCGVFDLDGIAKSLEIVITKIMWDNDLVSMIIISENKIIQKMKSLNEQSEYKDRLLATVSHDLRTPLNGIMGMIRMSLEIIEDQVIKKYLNVALRSSQLLLLMINDILDYSQISNGKLRLSYERFCLWSVIKDVSKLFKFQAKMKGIDFSKISFVGSRKEDSYLKSDQNRIKQVLFNLLGNALKFTVQGSIKIELKEWVDNNEHESNNEMILDTKQAFQISVSDTGIGIKKEDQANLFKFFGKIHDENTSTLNKSGVGLGLAISQTLVRILNNNRKNGVISCESEYNQGSCFSFVIYSNETEESKEDLYHKSLEEKSDKEMTAKLNVVKRELDKEWRSRKEIPNSPLKQIKRKKNILVVDDDQINVLVITSYLKTFKDFDFDVAFNGEEALNKVLERATQSYFYDFILMDCNMPKLNGFEAAILIDKLIIENTIPPLVMIACTANACPKDYEFKFYHGAFDHITKPFSKEEVRRKLDKYIYL